MAPGIRWQIEKLGGAGRGWLPTFLAFLSAGSPAGGLIGQAPELVFERVIGCELCEGPLSFGEVQSVSLGSDGTLVVTDAHAPHVRVFGIDGSVVRAFGPEGDGPGELRSPLDAMFYPDRSLVAIDVAQKRVTRFDSEGGILNSRPFPAFPAGAGYAVGPDRLLLTITDFQGGLTLVEFDDAGSIDTVLARVPFQDDGVMRFIAPAVRHDGGFAFGDGDDAYEIHLFRPDGALARRITRDIERRKRTPEELQASGGRSFRVSSPGSQRAEPSRGREREVDPLQPHFSSLTALRFDESDRLWVRTSRAPEGRTTFDLFDPDGAYLGETTIDREVRMYSVRNGWLAGVTRDANDVDWIGVWRVH